MGSATGVITNIIYLREVRLELAKNFLSWRLKDAREIIPWPLP